MTHDSSRATALHLIKNLAATMHREGIVFLRARERLPARANNSIAAVDGEDDWDGDWRLHLCASPGERASEPVAISRVLLPRVRGARRERARPAATKALRCDRANGERLMGELCRKRVDLRAVRQVDRRLVRARRIARWERGKGW